MAVVDDGVSIPKSGLRRRLAEVLGGHTLPIESITPKTAKGETDRNWTGSGRTLLHTWGMTHPVIEADALGRTFTVGKRQRRTTVDAVGDLSFTVEPGERVAFIGPNGAGKSTSIKMLTGILYPTSGTATVLGLIPWTERKALNRRIGTLFGQRSQLWNELPPLASFEVLGAIHAMTGPETERRVAELGELLDANELFDRPLRTLSLGQRMRCELAACMLHSPELLFLDEPSIGLDLLGKQAFREVLLTINRETGTTVFLTSHDVTDIEHVAARAIVVNHGTVIYDDTVDNMRRELLSTKRIEVGLREPPSEQSLASLRNLGGVAIEGDGERAAIDIGVDADNLVVHVDTSITPVRTALDSVLADLAVADLSIVDPPLETVIGEIYQRPKR